jgi:hypothetical protein
MADNEEASGSGKPFWKLSQELEEEEMMEVEVEEREEEEEEMEGADPDDMDIEEDDMDQGADDTTTTTSGGEDGTQQKKKARKDRKDRRPNQLLPDRQEITQVSENGYPLTPEEVVAGYGAQVACILRNTIPLNTVNLRSEENEHYCTLLLQRLHARYIFTPEYVNTDISKNPMNNAAITKMSTALASWKVRVKKLILKGQTFEEVNKSNPTVTEADYDEMKLKYDLNDIRTKEKSDWGKNFQSKNLGVHNHGSGGYQGKDKIWAREDAEYAAKGIENPWLRIEDPVARAVIRSKYHWDPKTKQLTTDPKVKRFEEILLAEEKASQMSSSQGSTTAGSSRWDTVLNRAMNVMKGWPKLKPPTSAGRVLGEGLSVKWSDKFGKPERGKRSLNADESRELRELREKVAQIPEIVDKQVQEKMTSFIPTIVQALGSWEAAGRVGPTPIPSMIGSNSNNAAAPNVPPAANTVAPNVLVTPVANIAAPEINAAAGTVQRSTPSVTCMPMYVGGPSTTDELDAVKVTKRRWLNLHFLHCVTYTLA